MSCDLLTTIRNVPDSEHSVRFSIIEKKGCSGKVVIVRHDSFRALIKDHQNKYLKIMVIMIVNNVLIFAIGLLKLQCGDSPCDQTEIPREKVTRVCSSISIKKRC